MLSALDLTAEYDGGRKPPVWVFDMDTPAEQSGGVFDAAEMRRVDEAQAGR